MQISPLKALTSVRRILYFVAVGVVIGLLSFGVSIFGQELWPVPAAVALGFVVYEALMYDPTVGVLPASPFVSTGGGQKRNNKKAKPKL